MSKQEKKRKPGHYHVYLTIENEWWILYWDADIKMFRDGNEVVRFDHVGEIAESPITRDETDLEWLKGERLHWKNKYEDLNADFITLENNFKSLTPSKESEPQTHWCQACRNVGMIHCADVDRCEGMKMIPRWEAEKKWQELTNKKNPDWETLRKNLKESEPFDKDKFDREIIDEVFGKESEPKTNYPISINRKEFALTKQYVRGRELKELLYGISTGKLYLKMDIGKDIEIRNEDIVDLQQPLRKNFVIIYPGV